MKIQISVLTLAMCVAPSALAGGIETHPFHVTWTWNGQSGPFVFSAQPIQQFDDKGGTRRLGRVRIAANLTWEATMVLNNPLPERQCVDYTSYNVESTLEIRELSGDPMFAVPNGAAQGRLGADPFQQASRAVSWMEPGRWEWTQREAPGISSCIGPGFIGFESEGAAAGFDTFRVLEADPTCNGGYLSGGPLGFSVLVHTFVWTGVWEYHWIDGGCKVDLTGFNSPANSSYGVPDGILDSEDFFYYLAQFAAGNLAVADLTATALPGSPGYGTPNGILNNDDFFYYLTIFAAGC